MSLLPVPDEVARTASLALATRAERGRGGTARGLVIATALTTGYVRPTELGELRRWHSLNPDAVCNGSSTLLGGLYGGAPARAWTAAAMNPAGEGAMISLPVARDVSSQIARPDGEPADEMHLTLFHFGGDTAELDPALRESLALVLREVAQDLAPPSIELSHVERFSMSDDGVEPVVVVSDSPSVYALRAAIEERLATEGAGFSDNHAFRAHVTIGYYAPGEGPEAGPVEESLGRGPWTISPDAVELHWGSDVEPYPLMAPRVEVDTEAEPREPVTAAVRTPMAAKLARISTTVNRTNRQTAAKLHSAATVALGEAIRQAGVKVMGRARTKTQRASIEAAHGVFTQAHYAAVGLTEQDLLDKRFDTFAAYATSLIAAAERRKLNAAASALGVDRDEVEAEYGPTIDSRAAAAAALMVTSLGLLARQALSGHAVTPETATGEFSGPVPYGVIRNALDVASRGASVPFVDETGPGPSAIDELSTKLTEIGETLVEDLLAAQDVRVQLRSTWVHGDPDRPFEPHADLDGVSWVDTQPDELAWDEGEFPYVSVLQPGDHIGCFPAGTIVSGPAATGSTLRWYEGEFVQLATASGQLLTATANHPILTPHGWVAAGLLVEGDDVIRCVDAQAIAALVPGDREVPAPIEQVAAAVGVAAGLVPVTVPVAAEDFHGDGVGSEVAVVRADRYLSSGDHSPLGQPARELALAIRAERPETLSRGSGSAESLEAVGSSPLRFVGGSSDSAPLLGRTFRGDGSQDLARGPLLDPRVTESGIDDATAYAERISDALHVLPREVTADDLGIVEREAWAADEPRSREAKFTRSVGDGGVRGAERVTDLLEGLASAVEPDQLVRVERYSGATHVYNLQTDTGWYLASSVLVHNCTCEIDTDYEPYGGDSGEPAGVGASEGTPE